MAKIKNKIKFWLIWSTFNLKLPITPYTRRRDAIDKIKELSQNNPDCEFYLLEAMSHFCTDKTDAIESVL